MEKEELRWHCKRLWSAETMPDVFELIEIYKSCLFEMFQILRRHPTDSRAVADAKLIPQMMFTKLSHLEQACHGISYITRDGSTKLNTIIDPSIVATLIRSVFEAVGVYNLIYLQPQTADEKLIVYNLWVISGLKYRQGFSSYLTREETKLKSQSEKDLIKKYIKQIEETEAYQSLDPKDREKIIAQIKQKKFQVHFKNGKPAILNGFQDIALKAGYRESIMGAMYTYFSLNAHPSNVAVFQFEQMFRSTAPIFGTTVIFNLKNVFFLLGGFIADLTKLFPEAKVAFETLPVLDQCVINYLNVFSRTDSYSINKIFERLE